MIFIYLCKQNKSYNNMENKVKQNIDLPENAFRELKDGEEYEPIMSPNKTYREV